MSNLIPHHVAILFR